MDCVEVCPVDCFYEGENMLVIHPDECIDCGVCEPECPVDAILPDSTGDKDFWVGEFSQLLKSLNIDKPIWVTEAMVGKCKVIPAYINTFVSGAEVIVDVGVNAPGMKMSKGSRKKLDNFIREVDGFKSVKLLSKKKAEFIMRDGSKKIIDF